MCDITMRVNQDCPHKEICYRQTAKPSEYAQSRANFEPDENGDCEFFTEIVFDVT